MRKLLMAIATLTAGLFAATTADAAARWTCDGPEYVCGAASAPVTKSYDASEGKATRSAKSRKQETVSSDDNDDKPVRRKARKQETVSSDGNDDKPARRRARRSNDDDNGGGTVLTGSASYYWEPQALASGGRFNPNAYTAAHKTLPFGTRVRVTNQRNGQSVDVVINDRGPYVGGRIIDLSKAAAHDINMQNSGVVPVTVRVLGRG
jgi:rare lipoprotein A